jgi:tetratricopeptide (TPR) repeat protein
LGKTQRGVALLQQAIKLAPDFADAYHTLGSILANQGNYAEGIAPLKRAVELDPSDATYQYALGNALRMEHSSPERMKEALRAYEASLALDPQAPWTHYYYGLTLENLGEKEAAIREYRRTLELHPKFGSAFYRLGLVYKAMGRVKEADSLLKTFDRESLVAIADVHGKRRKGSVIDTAQGHYERGMRFLNQGDRRRAEADFKVALQLDPHYSPALRQLRAMGAQ